MNRWHDDEFHRPALKSPPCRYLFASNTNHRGQTKKSFRKTGEMRLSRTTAPCLVHTLRRRRRRVEMMWTLSCDVGSREFMVKLVSQASADYANETVLNKLERRLGGFHARQRLGIETDHEAQIFGQGINFFHIENWYSIHSVIRTTLKLTGLYRRGRKNAERIQVKHNDISFKALPSRF